MCFCHIIVLKDSQSAKGWRRRVRGRKSDGEGRWRSFSFRRWNRDVEPVLKMLHERSMRAPWGDTSWLYSGVIWPRIKIKIKIHLESFHWRCLYSLYLPFFQQHITSGATFLIIRNLIEFKMTSAPEHLPPEYSVSTSLCLLVPRALKRLHYALQEIS